MIEVDFGFDAQPARMRPQFAEAAVGTDPHRLQHLDVAAAGRGRDDAGAVDGRNESGSAAVHDRDFGTVDLDDRVVDAEAVERRQHVFGGGNRRAGFIAEHGGELGGRDRTEIGGKLAIFFAA